MKLLNARINDRKIVITFLAIVFLGKSSSDLFTAFIASELGIFVYKDFKSRDAWYYVQFLLPLFMKSLVYLTYDTYDGSRLAID